MPLRTQLNREHYYWIAGELTSDEDAVITVTTVGPSHSCRVTLEVALGSAMATIAPIPGAVRTPTGVTVDVGTFAPSETRVVPIRVHPKRASRPGRRRVAVIRMLVNGELDQSTTVWARVERQR